MPTPKLTAKSKKGIEA